MLLNESAAQLADEIDANASQLQVKVSRSACGARLIDCGVEAPGGYDAGLKLAEVCLAGLGEVELTEVDEEFGCPAVVVRVENPVVACMASQYAGWKLTEGKYFAMGSGPMRAAAGKEAELFAEIGHLERPTVAVGVIEGKLPPDELVRRIAADCHVAPKNLTLLVARTASVAGTLQVVARSVETALHKLHTLKFDLSRIGGGIGVAPLPAVAKNDLAAVGRTNDAILYGGKVTLFVGGDSADLVAVGPQIPSCASPSFGEPFGVLFERAGYDFYQLDPALFSPAEVVIFNVEKKSRDTFGAVRPDIFARSADA